MCLCLCLWCVSCPSLCVWQHQLLPRMTERWRRWGGEGQTPVTSTQVHTHTFSIGQHDICLSTAILLLAFLSCLFFLCHHEARFTSISKSHHTYLIPLGSPAVLFTSQTGQKPKWKLQLNHLCNSLFEDTTGFYCATSVEIKF